MSTSKQMILSVATLGVLIAGVALSGCSRAGSSSPDAPDAPEPVVLETYEVPAGYQDELRNMLRAALGTDESRIGRVTNGPGGTILVVAPARIQAGVKQILSKDFEAPPVSSPVKLTYWLLVGRPDGSTPSEPSFSMVGRVAPKRLERTLREIASAQGPTQFALLEQIDLTSMSQQRGLTVGRFARVTQRATRSGTRVVAEISIALDDNSFDSQIMLEAGQFLVLGQSGFAGKRGEAFADVRNEDELTLYYVMIADLEP